MNKHNYALHPMSNLRHSPVRRVTVASSGLWRKLIPALLPYVAVALMTTQIVPHYGETVALLFSQITDGLSLALAGGAI